MSRRELKALGVDLESTETGTDLRTLLGRERTRVTSGSKAMEAKSVEVLKKKVEELEGRGPAGCQGQGCRAGCPGRGGGNYA